LLLLLLLFRYPDPAHIPIDHRKSPPALGLHGGYIAIASHIGSEMALRLAALDIPVVAVSGMPGIAQTLSRTIRKGTSHRGTHL
jgi:hypothetical protein